MQMIYRNLQATSEDIVMLVRRRMYHFYCVSFVQSFSSHHSYLSGRLVASVVKLDGDIVQVCLCVCCTFVAESNNIKVDIKRYIH